MKTEDQQTIYVALLNEGVDVWRPVNAQKIADGVYLILSNNDYDPDLETWQFPPGSKVICEFRKFAEDKGMVAVGLKT